MSEYVERGQVDRMIKDWQADCADFPAIHNQGNVLRDKLSDIPSGMSEEDFAAYLRTMTETVLAESALARLVEALEPIISTLPPDVQNAYAWASSRPAAGG